MNALSVVSRYTAHPLWAMRDRSPRLRYLREFERSQWASPEAIREETSARLRALLTQAVLRCPYYREQAERYGLNPAALAHPSDLAAWPVLDKKDIQQRGPDLMAEGWPQDDLFPDFTGGSTGSPLRFFLHHTRYESRTAGTWRHDRWAGWDLGEPRAILWGAPRDLSAATSWHGRLRNALLDRTLPLDATCLTSDSVAAYVEKLRRYRPGTLLAYAQSMVFFARYLSASGLRPPPLTGIITSAEVLSESDRQLIESVFGCRVYDRYGCREVGLIASQCPHGEHMHINAESVYVEFTRDGRPVAPGELGEILITDLRNYAMPLIRYRIGDLGAAQEGVCACGRGLPLMRIVAGRVSDFLVRRDGALVSGVALATYLITGRPGVAQVQMIQSDVDNLTVKVVPGARFTEADLDCLRERIARYLDASVQVTFELVESIPKEASGKYRFTISQVSPRLAFRQVTGGKA